MDSDGVRILNRGEPLPRLDLVEDGSGLAEAIVWPGMGAHLRSLHRIRLRAGAVSREQRHSTEAVYYVSKGSGRVLGGEDLRPGSMVHAEPDLTYAFEAGGEGIEIVGGPCPADPSLYPGATSSPPIQDGEGRRRTARVFHRDRPSCRMPLIAKDARAVVWPGVGAVTANMNYVDMRPGEENVPHVHPKSEDTIYILDGRGSIEDFDNGRTLRFEAGQAIHVPVGVMHAVRADRGSRVESVGGPCPADFDLFRRVGALGD